MRFNKLSEILKNIPTNTKINQSLSKVYGTKCNDSAVSKSKGNNKNNCKYNWPKDTENLVNIQIMNELFASHTYLSIANYFARTQIGLHGCAGFFLAQSVEERTHACKLMLYQNKRGGNVELDCIPKPEHSDWKSLKYVFEYIIQFEKERTNSLIDLYKNAEKNNDIMFTEYLSEEFLSEQINEIHTFCSLATRVNLAGDGLGIYLIDKEIQKKFPYKNDSDKIF